MFVGSPRAPSWRFVSLVTVIVVGYVLRTRRIRSGKETLFFHGNILKLCDAPPCTGGANKMSLNVDITPDLDDEEQVEEKERRR